MNPLNPSENYEEHRQCHDCHQRNLAAYQVHVVAGQELVLMQELMLVKGDGADQAHQCQKNSRLPPAEKAVDQVGIQRCPFPGFLM
jgi:hypothetical protein